MDPETIRSRAAQRIRQLRKASGLTQAELAERLGDSVATETISRMERGVLAPSLEWIARICDVVGVEVQDFFSKLPVTPVRPRHAEIRRVLDLLDPLDDEQLKRVRRLLQVHLEGEVTEAGGDQPTSTSA